MTNGSVPPVGYEQPEYSGQPGPLAGPEPAPEPEPPGPMLVMPPPGPDPDPPAQPDPQVHPGPERSGSLLTPPPGAEPPGSPAATGVGVEPQQPARPLWPSTWPAEAGGAYTGEHEVYTADQVKRVSPDDEAGDDVDVEAGNGEGADAAEGGDDPDEANTRFW
jgi:hypothetical protein